MSAIANIAILDDQGTPVTHTFYPVQSDPSALYRENLPSSALIGQGTISLEIRSKVSDSLQRVRAVLALPALETATGANANGYTAAPKVAYTNTATVDFILPARSTAAQRKDLRVLLSNLLLNDQVIDVIDNLNRPY